MFTPRYRVLFGLRIFMASVTTSIIGGALLVGMGADARLYASREEDKASNARVAVIEEQLKRLEDNGLKTETALTAHLALVNEQRLQVERRQAVIETQMENIVWLLRGTALGVIGLIIEVVFRLKRQEGSASD